MKSRITGKFTNREEKEHNKKFADINKWSEEEDRQNEKEINKKPNP